MEGTNYSMEELVPIVADLANKYTSFESTSISYERAQQLMDAVLYCIHEYESGETGSNMSKNGNIGTRQEIAPKEKVEAREAYRLGCQMVAGKAKAARELYNALLPDFRDFGNRAYRHTVLDEIPEFFRHYDVRFEPHAIWMPDYPLIAPIRGLLGVDLVFQYLRCIRLEQDFLARLPEGYPEQVLKAYQEDYRELFINLPEIILEDMQKRRTVSGGAGSRAGLVDELVDNAFKGNGELREYLKGV